MENYINSLFSINHALQNGFKSILDKYKVSNSGLPALDNALPQKSSDGCLGIFLFVADGTGQEPHLFSCKVFHCISAKSMFQ